jgi:uncharacterized protein
MARLLIWILLAVAAYAVVRNWSRAGARRARAAADKGPEAIVSCAACGLNVPQSEAHARAGRWYCSQEHLEHARPDP